MISPRFPLYYRRALLCLLLVSTSACNAQKKEAPPTPQPEASPAPSATAATQPAAAPSESAALAEVTRLTISDGHFRDAQGGLARFWGVNLVSLYPTHAQADGLAATLAGLQVNLVRPHHLLRQSRDWNPRMASGALVTYKSNSLEFDPDALDRFDYLNAALRKQGIYLAMSAHFSRMIVPGDADILTTDAEDRAQWIKGIQELSGWDWKKAIDPRKLLPVVDERAARVAEEFNRQLFTHKNPYTGMTYAEDPQILTLEVLNESSLEYAIICGNRFPAYFQARLEERWKAYCQEAGVAPSDLYTMPSPALKEVRAKFLRRLDTDYFLRMKAFIASLGCPVPVTYSNLWRGDNVNQMHAENADWMENHAYADPRMAENKNDAVYELGRTSLTGKPFFIGELNQAEGADKILKQKPYRTMLQVGMVAYGLLQDWDGMEWFAWTHGEQHLTPSGQALKPGRDADLGEMMNDRMMQDHLRALGYVFRHQLIQRSTEPVTIWADAPLFSGDYNGLLRGKINYKAGWQSVHQIRRAYGPVPPEQAKAPWMTQEVGNPIVSDTGEIVKDTKRRQLTVTAPQMECFSGYLDGAAPAGLPHLRQEGNELFATVVLVALDGKLLAESRHLLVSRTLLDKTLNEVSDPALHLDHLAGSGGWQVTVTRTRSTGAVQPAGPTPLEGGALPQGDWTECELQLP